MAITREQLDSVNASERHYDTEELPDGQTLRARTLLRGELRKQRLFFRNKKGEIDDGKWEYADDILLAFRLVDTDGNPLVTPDEAFNGYFDGWSQEWCSAALRLLKRVQAHERASTDKDDLRDTICDQLASRELTDESTMVLIEQLRQLADDNTTSKVDAAVKNSE